MRQPSFCASAIIKKPNSLNGVKIQDAETSEEIKLKRRRIEGDIIAQDKTGEIVYRMPVSRIITGVQRRMFTIEDRAGNVVGETIRADALPKKSLLRDKLEGYGNGSLLFKDDDGVIYYTGFFPEGPGERKSQQTIVQMLRDVVKIILLYHIATKIPFLNGPTVEHAVFKVSNTQKATPSVIMMTYLFNEWIEEAADSWRFD